mmetsp:Transcript_4888/g.9280  ORF Transcript_4888/g.9280 Transcript_4888/m.9280 type:complete len:380 (+) Transcript_4888:83-1222(+)
MPTPTAFRMRSPNGVTRDRYSPNPKKDIENGAGGAERVDKGVASERSNEAAYGMIQVAVCLMLFMVIGPSLIMVNKHILRDLGFDFPITLTLYSSIFCSTVVWIYVLVFNVHMANAHTVTRAFYMRNIMPIGFLQGATIVLGMSSYLYLSVSFVQMLKASTPVMIVSLLSLFGMGTPTRMVLASVLVISFGTVLSGYGEINFQWIGVASMLGAQATEALRLVFTQKLLKNLKFSVVEGLCFVTPAAAFWTFLLAAVKEFPRMDTSIAWENKHVFIVAGFLAVGVNTINSVVVKFTSSLMMKLLSTARNASLVLVNVMFFGEVVTGVQLPGYVISLGGFLMYNYYRNKGGAVAPARDSTKAGGAVELTQPEVNKKKDVNS